jgi:hypothetical protein
MCRVASHMSERSEATGPGEHERRQDRQIDLDRVPSTLCIGLPMRPPNCAGGYPDVEARLGERARLSVRPPKVRKMHQCVSSLRCAAFLLRPHPLNLDTELKMREAVMAVASRSQIRQTVASSPDVPSTAHQARTDPRRTKNWNAHEVREPRAGPLQTRGQTLPFGHIPGVDRDTG